jgi:hypothetical protein
MDPAFGRNLDAGEPADEALSDFPRTPAGVLALYVQDIVHEAEIVGSRRRVRIPPNTPHQLFSVQKNSDISLSRLKATRVG